MRKFLLISMILGFMFTASELWAQERTVSGKVTSMEDGTALPGVNVILKGTTTGTVTDIDGNYTLSVPSDGGTLVFSFIGLATEEVAIGSKSVIDVQMSQDVKQLSEVVVVAYGEQTRASITGAVTKIESGQIEKVQTGNVVQGLTGKVAGVEIINQDGQPGSSPTVRFRGIGTINASEAPLYVVDGVPYQGNINAINPRDIESMTFLKDASSAALYGSRGANGVIVITTKKGSKKGFEVNVSSKYGISDRAVPEYDKIDDPGEYYEVWWERIRLGEIHNGATPSDAAQTATNTLINGTYGLRYNNYDVADDEVVLANGELNPDANLLYHDDWEDELYGTGTRQEHYVSIRSNTDNLGTLFSLGYLDDEGFLINSGFERITGRISADYTYNENIKLGMNVNYAHTDQNAPIQNVASNTISNAFRWTRTIAPIFPIWARNSDGSFLLDGNGERVYDFGDERAGMPTRVYSAFGNPYATTLEDIDRNVYENLSGRAYTNIGFLKDFELSVNIAMDMFGGSFTSLATPIGGDAFNSNGRLTRSTNKGVNVSSQQFLRWSKDFGDHSFGVLVGHESNSYNFEYLEAEFTNLVVPDLPVPDNATSFVEAPGYENNYNVEGFLGRLTYSYDNRYFLDASFRRDGSSVFSPENRWGSFYGLGASWLVSEEAFLDGVNWIDMLKIKASFGQQGNDGVLYNPGNPVSTGRNYYAYLDQYQITNAGGGEAGVTLVEVGNPDLVWETTTNFNAGFEIGIFNRVNLGVEYFIRDISDMIYNVPTALSSGISSRPLNAGDMENKGVEFTLDANIIQTQDWNWSFNFNATHYKNEITAVPEELKEGFDDGRFQLEVGRSRYDLFMREFVGVDPTNGDALWTMVEEDGTRTTTNIYSEATEVFLDKSAIPDLTGGFSTGIQYKGWGLNVGFAYQLGGWSYDGGYAELMDSNPTIGQNFSTDVYDSWTPENPDASIPRMDALSDNNLAFSSFFLVESTYLSLQDITLSYNLPTTLLDKIGITNAQVLLTANNVKLWSKRDGLDPRLSSIGSSTNEYTIVRNFSMGVNLTF